MTTDQYISKLGLRIDGEQRDDVLQMLAEQSRLERERQGSGDTEVMRLFCVQLFSLGIAEDALSIWAAKTSSMDADASIEVQLLCGTGLDQTRNFLAQRNDDSAELALRRIDQCVKAGDFEDFSPEAYLAECEQYFLG